jgi:hypothetical protein
MSNPDGVLAAIDACLDDYALSDDAMRWAPEEPDPTEQTAYAPGGVVWSGGGWPVIRDEAADLLRWSTDISPAREAIVTDSAFSELLRIRMPDSTGNIHRVVSVAPGDRFGGEYVLTLEPAAVALSEAMASMGRAAETALEGFGKAFGPILSATQAAMHKATYRDNRKHIRRCPTCNPRGFPKPLPINGHEYHRRQRRRNRR